jgi:hypothetical protein
VVTDSLQTYEAPAGTGAFTFSGAYLLPLSHADRHPREQVELPTYTDDNRRLAYGLLAEHWLNSAQYCNSLTTVKANEIQTDFMKVSAPSN